VLFGESKDSLADRDCTDLACLSHSLQRARADTEVARDLSFAEERRERSDAGHIAVNRDLRPWSAGLHAKSASASTTATAIAGAAHA
jgi:hypothetical protein